MPTIKRNGGVVILKGGKVSCSCCEEDCEGANEPTYNAFYEGENYTLTRISRCCWRYDGIEGCEGLAPFEERVEWLEMCFNEGSGFFEITGRLHTLLPSEEEEDFCAPRQDLWVQDLDVSPIGTFNAEFGSGPIVVS